MKIPMFLKAITGVVFGLILFLIGIAVLSGAFVVAVKAVEFARAFALEHFSNFSIHEWLPL